MIALTPGAARRRASPGAARRSASSTFDRSEDALRVLARRRRLRCAASRPGGGPRSSRRDCPTVAALVLPDGALTESEVKRLLAAYGVTVAPEQIAATPEAAAAAAPTLGFPVALKAVSRRIVHKSDAGAVRLGLTSADAVATAARDMRDKLRAAGLDAGLEGFSVQPMIRGEAEVIVGARRDPHFGAVVMVGLGGLAVEILNDVALAPAPVSVERARALITSLRGAPLLSGARGRPPLDVAAVAEAVARVSGWPPTWARGSSISRSTR
jgi:acyl-CoA synthetase (NDP forming)